MKTKFRAKIDKIEQAGGGTCKVTFKADGRVEEVNVAAKDAAMEGFFWVKDLVGKQISLGTVFTIVLTEEELTDDHD